METSSLSQLVVDMYECWKTGQKYEPSVKVRHHFEAVSVISITVVVAVTSSFISIRN